MTRSTTVRAGAAVAAALALTLSACSGGGDTPGEDGELTAITVSQIVTMDSGPLHLGIEQGFFEEEGLDVTVEIAEAGSAIVPQVVSQESAIGYANVVSDLQAIDGGLPILLVANCCGVGTEPETDASQIYTLADGDFTTVESLANANIAVNSTNNLGDLTIRAALEAQGVPTENIEFTPLPYSDMGAALERGDVDAIWSVEPFKTLSDEAGYVSLLSNFVGAFPDTTLGYYITSEQYAAQNPEVVAAFQAAIERSNEYATENPDAVRDVLEEKLGLDRATLDAANFNTFPAGLDRESVEVYGAEALRQGMISAEPDYDAIFFENE